MWSPTSSMSVVRKLFWLLVNRRDGGVCSPVKKGLKGTMPALVNNKVGSPAGINDALGMGWCPFSSKKLMKAFLISSPVISQSESVPRFTVAPAIDYEIPPPQARFRKLYATTPRASIEHGSGSRAKAREDWAIVFIPARRRERDSAGTRGRGSEGGLRGRGGCL